MPDKLSGKQKKDVLNKLYKRDGKRCHYCNIEEEDFPVIWGEEFYGARKRGQTLEIDHKDNDEDNNLANLVLACALCNMAKSDKFKYDEFLKVGKVVEEIWRKRKSKLKVKTVK